MARLLRANFARLFQNAVFRIILLLIVAGVFFVVCDQKKYNSTPDGLLFSGGMLVSILSAVFTTLFIGTEYSDGTMRNKICIGHSRAMIYGANLVTCTAAAVMMQLVLMVAVVLFGIPIIGSFSIGIDKMLPLFVCSILTTAVFASLYIFMTMLITSKAVSAVSAVLLSFLMLFSASFLGALIDAPEFIPEYKFGGSVEMVENPRYPSETERRMMQTALNVLPTGQALQIAEQPEHTGVLALYALGEMVVMTAAGLLVFGKKDLK